MNYSIKLVFVYFRLTKLEKKVYVENGEMPSLVLELQNKVEDFKDKLQVVWIFTRKCICAWIFTRKCICAQLHVVATDYSINRYDDLI